MTATTVPTGAIPELTLGWRLQIALHHGGMTTEQMAAELEVTRGTISRWCNDKGAAPKTVYLRHWAMTCGVDADWLLHGPSGDGWAPSGSNRRPTD